MTNLREFSRTNYGTVSGRPTADELKLGSLQRIADATELMAKNYDQLIRDRDWWKRLAKDQEELRRAGDRRIASLRGQITKLKKQITELKAKEVSQ